MRADESLNERAVRRLQIVEKRYAEYGEAFNSIEHARSTGRAHVVAIGDCHLRVIGRAMQRPDAPPLMPHVWLDPCIVGGATARGLRNPSSASGAVPVFRRRVELAQPWQPLVFMLGEADTGFQLWYTRHTLGESIEAMYETIDTYIGFLREVHEQGFDKIFVLSVPFTPGHRRIRKVNFEVSQEDRTELGRQYNLEMERRADFYTYVDVTTPTLDPATGLVTEEYIDPHDPDHLLSEPYGRVIADVLGPLLTPP
jgi:hypothetical protein